MVRHEPRSRRRPADPESVGAQRLQAAHLIGAAGLSILAQFAVDMPGGYFGPADTTTRFGLLYAGAVTVLAALGVAACLTGSRWRALLSPLFFSLNVGIFFGPVIADPVVAGSVLLWHLVLVGGFLFPLDPAASWTLHPRVGEDEEERTGRWLERNGRAVLHLSGLAMVLTVLAVGFEMGHRAPALIVCILLDLLALAASIPFLIGLLRTRRLVPVLAVGFLIAALSTMFRPELALGLFAGYLAIVWASIIGRTQLFSEILRHFYGQPAVLILASFGVLILAGTLFLSFPAASATGEGIPPLDALFTATSASCVTGLIVLDTPHAFSSFGHVILLILIQMGGLNIMVLSTFAALLLGRELGLRGERALGAILDLQQGRSAYRLIVFIVTTTLLVEGIGAIGLAFGYRDHGYGTLASIWNGLFHSVSAFCNAGFALQSDSLTLFRDHPLILLLLATLITLGGLGFAFLAFVWSRLRGHRALGFTVQARLVVAASAILTGAGTLLIGAAEWNRSLAGLAPLERAANALFQSVALRTAGFNTIPLDSLHSVTIFGMMLFMFIGASPGGTGGGIKTTTAAVLFSAIPALARGSSRIVLFRRTIPLETIYRSAAIAVVGSLLIIGGGGLLLATQDQPFVPLLFETFSAFGTVGLSLGATGGLDGLGKGILIIVMLLGRIGPLMLALLLGRGGTGRLDYPDARIMVG
ncbi:MAG: hypothetical protein GF346_01725 [Candidatus Eisenbacteria bacterium]|nr:hypothetical protein [Candidatus Latescibacterota bacterium]MBD3301150.1 hypothetical protein [Candidatus Eisenbacteria bacterium]